MADKAITELDALTAVAPTDELPIVDDSANTTKKVTINDLLTLSIGELTDDSYMGFVIEGINAGEAITQWDTVYLDDTENEWMQANAAAANHFPAMGIACNAASNGQALTVLVIGVVRNDGWGTGVPSGKGKTVYLGETVGAITETAPSTSGDCVQVIGFTLRSENDGDSEDIIFFNFTGHYLELE